MPLTQKTEGKVFVNSSFSAVPLTMTSPMGKLASGLSSIYSRYFLFGVLFVLAFVTAFFDRNSSWV